MTGEGCIDILDTTGFCFQARKHWLIGTDRFPATLYPTALGKHAAILRFGIQVSIFQKCNC